MKVTKKPLTYQAFEFTGENQQEILVALGDTVWETVQFGPESLELYRDTSRYEDREFRTLYKNWYLVVSSKGEVWVCSPEGFKEDWEINE